MSASKTQKTQTASSKEIVKMNRHVLKEDLQQDRVYDTSPLPPAVRNEAKTSGIQALGCQS